MNPDELLAQFEADLHAMISDPDNTEVYFEDLNNPSYRPKTEADYADLQLP